MRCMDQSRPFSEHRQKRRELWASLWLARIVRLLSGFANLPMPDAWRSWFDCVLRLLTKAVVCLVLIRAAQLKPAGRRYRNPRQIARAMKRHDIRVIDRGGMRDAAGGYLRRAVRVGGFQAKDFQARADKLLRVLKMLDVWAARTVRRTRDGLTRLAELHTGVALPLPAAICADARGAKAGQVSALFRGELRVALAPP